MTDRHPAGSESLAVENPLPALTSLSAIWQVFSRLFRSFRSDWLHPRLYTYLVVGVVVLLPLQWLLQNTLSTHRVWFLVADAGGVALAIATGVVCLAYYLGFKGKSLLYLSAGFVGAGIMNMVHVFSMLSLDETLSPTIFATSEDWSSMASRLYLAVMLLAGRKAAEGRISPASTHDLRDSWVIAISNILLIILLALCFALPRVVTLNGQAPAMQAMQSAIGLLYLAALVIFLRRGDWRYYPFQHWMVLSLILAVIGQLFYIPLSTNPEDSVLLASHAIRLGSYAMVFIALLSSTSNLFRQASSIQLEDRINALIGRQGSNSAEEGAGSTLHSKRVTEAGTFELDLVTGQFKGNRVTIGLLGGLDNASAAAATLEQFAQSVHPDDRARLIEALQRSQSDGELFKQQFRVNSPGGYRWLEAVGGVESVDDKPVRMLGFIDDITGRKNMEREKECLYEELHESVKAHKKSNDELQLFANIVSHDLQEPLRMVSSFMTLLERRYASELNEEAREFIQFAVEGSTRMRSLLDGLLEYSRVRSKGIVFEPLNLAKPVADAVANLAVLIRERGAEITVAALPEIRGDAAQLIQLFQNLIANGIKFCQAQPPKIAISSHQEDGRCVVEVSDNGIGIEPAHYQRIFQIFSRLHSREAYPGTGVGLAVCKQIMERHGGRIEVESLPDQGSTFKLCF